MGIAACFSNLELRHEITPDAGAARRIEQYAIGFCQGLVNFGRCLDDGIVDNDAFHREAGLFQKGAQIA